MRCPQNCALGDIGESEVAKLIHIGLETAMAGEGRGCSNLWSNCGRTLTGFRATSRRQCHLLSLLPRYEPSGGNWNSVADNCVAAATQARRSGLWTNTDITDTLWPAGDARTRLTSGSLSAQGRQGTKLPCSSSMRVKVKVLAFLKRGGPATLRVVLAGSLENSITI